MARDPKVGRAETMRRSMLALIDKGEPHEAHPAYWAPFVVVGEGAASAIALPLMPSASSRGVVGNCCSVVKARRYLTSCQIRISPTTDTARQGPGC